MGNITQRWVRLLIPFTSGYKQRFTETELARLSKIPQQSASRYLNALVSENLLNYEIQGRNKLFFIDFSKHTAFTILQTIENYKSLEFQQKVKEVSLIINEVLGYSDAIVLFGSYSSYSFNKESDVDIIIAGKSEKNRVKEIKRKYSVSINEHYASYGELAKALKTKNALSIEIQKSHVLFGDISKIVQIMMETAS
ncbi:nucleotidyltransferase domain-containing protein [Candidatus Woesearchaeota archaeon]|nr:nucleotidyltransferase domain-containing protein [Candidatus Woesearchaeota archaeon]